MTKVVYNTETICLFVCEDPQWWSWMEQLKVKDVHVRNLTFCLECNLKELLFRICLFNIPFLGLKQELTSLSDATEKPFDPMSVYSTCDQIPTLAHSFSIRSVYTGLIAWKTCGLLLHLNNCAPDQGRSTAGTGDSDNQWTIFFPNMPGLVSSPQKTS